MINRMEIEGRKRSGKKPMKKPPIWGLMKLKV
jgi:hypothetical protein